MVINKAWLLKIALGFFMVPYLLFALTWGDFAVYRALQVVWLLFLLLAASIYSGESIHSSSFQALTITAVLMFSLLVSVVSDLSTYYGIDADLLMKTVMFVAVVLLIDRFRGIGFEGFLTYSLPGAITIVVATVVHFAWNPEMLYDRYLFFGLHPNLGGEILLCCSIIIIVSHSKVVRLLFGVMILSLLILLQSRAALLGVSLVMLLGEATRILSISDKSTRYRMIGLTFVVVGASFFALVIFGSSFISRIGSLIYSDVLLMDNSERGLGTGLVGREDTWWVALSAFAENPFFGVGLDRVVSEDELDVHNGYLALIAQFGILSIGFFIVLGFGLIESFRQRSIRFAVILACMFVFTFNARSVNLNAFPLILWIACLPWANQPKQLVRGGDKELSPI